MNTNSSVLEVSGPVNSAYAEILSEEALAFIAALAAAFSPRVAELLELREQRQQDIDGGKMPDFLPETRDIRESGWNDSHYGLDCRGVLRDSRISRKIFSQIRLILLSSELPATEESMRHRARIRQ